MPYIKKEDRIIADKIIEDFLSLLSEQGEEKIGVGKMNYMITKLLLSTEPKKYEDYNALIGVLECCKQEFYRRAVATYEDRKIKENSDVYGKG